MVVYETEPGESGRVLSKLADMCTCQGSAGGLEARVAITKRLQWDGKGSPPGRGQ